MSIEDDALILGAAALALYVGARYLVGQLTGDTGALNPTNPDNIVNKGATALYQGVTGSTGTIGGDLYDATHGGALDVSSDHNAIYSGVSGLGEAITGTKGWDLGSKIYDWTH